jgi:hypothetical protein
MTPNIDTTTKPQSVFVIRKITTIPPEIEKPALSVTLQKNRLTMNANNVWALKYGMEMHVSALLHHSGTEKLVSALSPESGKIILATVLSQEFGMERNVSAPNQEYGMEKTAAALRLASGMERNVYVSNLEYGRMVSAYAPLTKFGISKNVFAHLDTWWLNLVFAGPVLLPTTGLLNPKNVWLVTLILKYLTLILKLANVALDVLTWTLKINVNLVPLLESSTKKKRSAFVLINLYSHTKLRSANA